MLAPWKKSYDQPKQHIQKQRYYFANKRPSSLRYCFPSSHVWMWEVDHKESWVAKNWCFWTVVLENTFESPLDCKEIQPVNLKGNQSWILIGGNAAEVEAPQYFNQLMWRTYSLEKTLMLGKLKGRRRGWQGVRWLDGITDSMELSLSNLQKMLKDRKAWHATVCGVERSQTLLSNWAITTVL